MIRETQLPFVVARALDKNMDLNKMRVKALRELMQVTTPRSATLLLSFRPWSSPSLCSQPPSAQEFGVDCPNCLEKSDMIKRIQETIMKDKKEL